MSCIDITNLDEYKTYRNQRASESNKSGLVVVKCSTSWCGPCKQIQPAFEELAKKYKNLATFLHVDIEEPELMDEDDFQDVRGVPTFKFIKNGKEVGAFSGANIDKVKALLKKHCEYTPATL